MQVNMIQKSNYNNQQNFNGYVDKKLVDYVKQTSNEVVQNVLVKHDYKNKILDEKAIDLIKKISEQTDKILETLSNSVKKLEPNTCLTGELKPVYSKPRAKHSLSFSLSNPLLHDKSSLEVATSDKQRSELSPENRFLDLVDMVLKTGKENFSEQKMKENETEMVYNYVDGLPRFKNIREKIFARKFQLPSNWFKVKKEQKNAEIARQEAEYKEQQLQQNIEEKVRQEKEHFAQQIKDSIKNKNLETIKDYLK